MHKRYDRFLIQALLIFFVPVSSILAQSIIGSEHDFTASNNWFTSDEICEVCHTPHHAETTLPDAPLWNHELSITTYTLYGSPTIDGTIEQPNTHSKLCLSCHDGTVALDNYSGNGGTEFIDGVGLIGTDLSDDHPVSISWDHQTIKAGSNEFCANCHNMHGNPTWVSEIPFFDRKVECASCHEPHNASGIDKFLRLPLANSELCMHCHDK